jgi:hypothetical protein
MPNHSSKSAPRRRARRVSAIFALSGIIVGTECGVCWAQTGSSPRIKVESPEVVLPIKVIRETKSTGAVEGSNGEPQLGWVLHSTEVTGLSAKSVHIFDDGVETKIQHFSVEKVAGWEVRDNVSRHFDYSCTPRSIWAGPDIMDKSTFDDSRLHTYLVTYVPRPSPMGSCHQIAVKVDHKHTTIFAPNQYCNTKNPLSDPLKDTELGNRLMAYANSTQGGSLSLSLQVVPFAASADTARINLSAEMPAKLLNRHWDGIHLIASIAIVGLIFDSNGTLVARFSDAACAPAEESIGYQGPLLPPTWAKEQDEHATIPSGYQTQVDLGPGDYHVELLITDGEKFGRAAASLTVKDFTKELLAISGIALCKRYHKPLPDERGPTRAPQYVPLMFDDQEFTPAGNTHFKKGEQLFTYVEIYGSEIQTAGAAKIYLEIKVTDEKTNELKIGTGARLVDSPMRPENLAIPVVWDMEVAKLPPGAYRLEVQASDSAGNKTPWRSTSFTVE